MCGKIRRGLDRIFSTNCIFLAVLLVLSRKKKIISMCHKKIFLDANIDYNL